MNLLNRIQITMTELPTSLPRSSRFLQLRSDEWRVSQIITLRMAFPDSLT